MNSPMVDPIEGYLLCLGSPALHLSSQPAKENANGTKFCSLGRLRTKMPSSASMGRRSY